MVELYDLDTEQTLLGTMLKGPKIVPTVLDALDQEAFWLPSHVLLYRKIGELSLAGVTADPITLADAMTPSELASLPGGRLYLHTLYDYPGLVSNWLEYARIISENHRRRQLAQASEKIAGLAQSADIDQAEIRALELVQSLKTGRGSDRLESPAATAVCFEDLENRRIGANKGLPLPPEWPTLRKTIEQLERGTLTIVGARPGVGKTMWALQLQAFLCDQGFRVLYVSRELTVVRLVRRHIVREGALMAALRCGHLSPEDERARRAYIDRQATWQVLYDSRSSTVAEIRWEASRWRADCVFVDYLQRLPYKGAREYDAITGIVNELQDLALDTNIPVVCLSQLSRPQKGQEHKPPNMASTRGSGAVEERAANLILLHRDHETHKDSFGNEVAGAVLETGLFIVAKCTDGEADTRIPVRFSGKQMRIAEATL